MHLAPIIQDLAVILGVAAVITYIFKVIKQPVVLGYVVAGIIVGPYTSPLLSVLDIKNVTVWAELGVIFLMFSLGLEFSFRKLLKLGPSAAFTGVFQIICMIFAGTYLAKNFGWSKTDAMFLGCMISVSSTTIIIKALEELNLKSKKFAELTFGILIVEDLAAILMLVGLTSFATKALVEPMEILMSGGKLLFVVSLWIILGIFVVPGFVKRIAKKGNDEMLTIASLGLCLGLVTLAAKFEYSVALGAFIMGSILAESSQVKRIEHLINPLKDVFGAIFFVSVGMLLDPQVVVSQFSHVVILSLVIILGKILSVTLGSFLTGQTLSTSIHTGFSMAQIGEFSFIIASLGQSLGVINNEIYPIIVAASLVTTFTTPYLVKFAGPVSKKIESLIPDKINTNLQKYSDWFQTESSTTAQKRKITIQFARFCAHGAVILALFILASRHLIGWVEEQIPTPELAKLISWVITIIVASPFIWAMLAAFRDQGSTKMIVLKGRRPTFNFKAITSTAAVLIFISSLSAEFFSGWISLVVFILTFLIMLVLFRKKIKTLSVKLEKRFMEGFEHKSDSPKDNKNTTNRLLPWDAHLIPIEVPASAKILGKTLLELKLREKYGINVIAIDRGEQHILAPSASEQVFPYDVLLCFASDQEIDRFRAEMIEERQVTEKEGLEAKKDFILKHLRIPMASNFVNTTIKDTGIYSKYHCLVVGLERGGQRSKSPKSDHIILGGDIIWIIGSASNIQKLTDDLIQSV